MLKKFVQKKDFFGSVILFKDSDRGVFLVEPRGIINPSLVKFDLGQARSFGESIKKEWIYIVNTENVVFPNPVNLIYLKQIKSLPYLKSYFVYAPSVIPRLLGIMASCLLRPDQILNSKAQLNAIINQTRA